MTTLVGRLNRLAARKL